jgi:membrane associated rhomboid family serine protease
VGRKDKPSREPIFNVPGVILALLILLGTVHVARTYGLSDEQDTLATLAMAFIPARYTGGMEQLPGGWLSALYSPFTHMLVHADATHLALNSAWLLVFGAIVARRLGSLRLVVFTLVTGLAGALAFALVHWGALLPVVGASGAVSGLMGGAIRLMHAVMRVGAMREIAVAANFVPLAGIGETLRDRQVLIIIAVTLAINLGLGASGSLLTPGSGGIAWEAHMGGFLVGLLGFGLIDPGPRPLPPLPELPPE